MKTATQTSKRIATTVASNLGRTGDSPQRGKRRSQHACLIWMATLALLVSSPASAADYTFYSGLNDDDYASAKYMQFGWIDALDALGLTRAHYLASSPWMFYENSFGIPVCDDAIAPYDSSEWGADYSTVLINVSHSGTFKNPTTGSFYFVWGTKYSCNGRDYVTSREIALGESAGYFSANDYPGHCRYVFALGCNAMAMGPAMSDGDSPTYSRHDLFNANNPNHANPFKIWGPHFENGLFHSVITNGVRLVMGCTDYSNFSGPADRAKYDVYDNYIQSGDSIAIAFVRASLNAFPGQKPVVLAQGATQEECKYIIEQERTFTESRPSGTDQLLLYWWGTDRCTDYDGPYAWNSLNTASNPQGIRTLGSQAEALALPGVLSVFTSTDSQDVQNATLSKYLEVLGVAGNGAPKSKAKNSITLCKIDEDRKAVIDHSRGSLYYRDVKAAMDCTGPCELTQGQCATKAMDLLVANGIVAPGEVCVDRVIAVTQMAATQEEIETNTYTSAPEVVRYMVVLKRNMGELPILTNDTDTITVELGSAGKLVSLTSEYAYGRTLVRHKTVTPSRLTKDEAKSVLPVSGTVRDLRAGLLPLADGSYVPVYEVITMTNPSSLGSQPEVSYYRIDTLAPVTQGQEQEGYELEEAPIQQSKR